MTEQESVPMTWVTASDVKSFAVCPWIVYEQKVLKHFLNMTSLSMAKGSLEHEARRRLIDQVNEQKTIGFETIEKVVEKSFLFSEVQNGEFSFSLRREKEALTARLRGELKDFTAMPPAQTEVRLLSAQRGLVGRVDCLYQVDGKYIPCDYKTGYPGLFHHSNVLQVVTYAMMLEDNAMPVEKGMIYYTKSQERVLFPVTDELRDEVMSIAQSVRMMLAGRWVAPREPLTVEQCRSCYYKGLCEDYLRAREVKEEKTS